MTTNNLTTKTKKPTSQFEKNVIKGINITLAVLLVGGGLRTMGEYRGDVIQRGAITPERLTTNLRPLQEELTRVTLYETTFASRSNCQWQMFGFESAWEELTCEDIKVKTNPALSLTLFDKDTELSVDESQKQVLVSLPSPDATWIWEDSKVALAIEKGKTVDPNTLNSLTTAATITARPYGITRACQEDNLNLLKEEGTARITEQVSQLLQTLTPDEYTVQVEYRGEGACYGDKLLSIHEHIVHSPEYQASAQPDSLYHNVTALFIDLEEKTTDPV